MIRRMNLDSSNFESLFGAPLSPEALERLNHYAQLLLAENERANLTGARDIETLAAAHLADALAYARLVRTERPDSLVDLGSGGGLPGLAIACLFPELPIVLIDATRKKVDALRRMIAALELPNVFAEWGRAEVITHQANVREQAGVCVARAVGKLPLLVELASGFVEPGGQCWFGKSAHRVDEEIAAAARAANVCKLRHMRNQPYTLPADHGDHAIAIFEKTDPLPKRYPRSAAQLKQQPL